MRKTGMIADSFDSRTLANMEVALEHACKGVRGRPRGTSGPAAHCQQYYKMREKRRPDPHWPDGCRACRRSRTVSDAWGLKARICIAGVGVRAAQMIQRPGKLSPSAAPPHAIVARSSLSAPRATIFSASSGNGRCKALASSHGARTQTSRSSSVVRITGMAFGWIGSTIAFGAVVRKPKTL